MSYYSGLPYCVHSLSGIQRKKFAVQEIVVHLPDVNMTIKFHRIKTLTIIKSINAQPQQYLIGKKILE